MRISSLDLQWFRGASHSVPLECNARSVVIYGANGSGKSSFADALEYLVSNGKIHHLAHEYSGKKQEKGIRNTHAPEDSLSKIIFKVQDGSSLEVSISHDGISSIESDPPSLLSEVQAWDLERFILRQDEVARFIHATKGQKYSVLLPLLGLESFEQCVKNFNTLIGAIAERIELPQKKARLSVLKEDALKHLPKPTKVEATKALMNLASAYLEESPPAQFEKLFEAVKTEIDGRIISATPAQQRYMLLKQIQDEEIGEKLLKLEESEKAATEAFDELLERRIAVLEPSLDFVEAVEPDLKVINCPACGREIPVDDFEHHVTSELELLKAARVARDDVIEARKDFSTSMKQISKLAKADEINVWLRDAKRKQLCEALDHVIKLDLTNVYEKWSKEVWRLLRSNIPILVTKVKNAVKRAPPSVEKLIQDGQIISICEVVPEITSLKREISKIETLLNVLENAETKLRDEIKKRTEATITGVSEEIRRIWAVLHPDEPIEEVSLYIPGDAEKAIDISLKFFGVDQPSPRLTLSEGHRNSLGLCIFLALVLQEKDHDRPIILDDVVSSLDREHRGMLVKVLNEDFKDRQVILLTHDREWFSELRMRLPAATWIFKTLKPWENPKIGIQWAQSNLTFDDARVFEENNPEAAGNRVRAIMDTQLAIIAESLKVNVEFARGDRNDRRTCIEFLERIISEARTKLKKKEGKKYESHNEPIEKWNESRSLLLSWANRASHGGTLTKAEAKQLINTCEEALTQFWCDECEDPIWIADQAKRERLQCSCGQIQWRYG